MLDELTDAKNNLVQHTGSLPRHWILGSSLRLPGPVLEDSSDLPLLGLRAGSGNLPSTDKDVVWQRLREANTKIRKSLVGRSRPMRGDHVRGDAVYYWESMSKSPSVTRPLDGSNKSHRSSRQESVGFIQSNSDQMWRKNKFGWHHLL